MESLVNSDFVDEMFPEKPLHPRDPAEKAVGRLRVEKHCKLTQHFYKIVWLPSTEEERRASWDQLLNKVKAQRKFLNIQRSLLEPSSCWKRIPDQ